MKKHPTKVKTKKAKKILLTSQYGHYIMLALLFLMMPLFIVVILYRQGYLTHAQLAVTNCTVSAADDAMDGEETNMVNLINTYRQQNGLQALTVSSILTQAASWMSRDMATRLVLDHTDSLGRSPQIRGNNCGYPAGMGENLDQEDIAGAQQAFTDWQQSPEHNANMLTGTYREIGVAYSQGGDGNYYWTADFGNGSTTSTTTVGTGTTVYNPYNTYTNPYNYTNPYIYQQTLIPTLTWTPTPTMTETPTPTESPTPTETPSPTATPIPNPAMLQLSVKLHGVGSGGDNLNPNNTSGGNNNPVHPQRSINVELTNPQISGVLPVQQGTLTYDPAQGIFTASFKLDPITFPEGEYLMTISTPTYLHRLVPSIQKLIPGETTNISVDLVAGDADGDNHLTILDYNELFDCFSSLAPAIACTDTLKAQTDFNDDGKVDQLDYNLFLRELAAQNGN